MSMKKVFPPRLCSKKGCVREHMARGLCCVHYNNDLSWTGVKCKAQGCKKFGRKKSKVCDSHRKIYKLKILRKKKICIIEGCGKGGCVKVFFQDGKEMYKTILKFCFGHLRGNNKNKVERDARVKAATKKESCKICHSNPAELCVPCMEEKR